MTGFNPKTFHGKADAQTPSHLSAVERKLLTRNQFNALSDQAKQNLSSQRVLDEISHGLMTIENAKKMTAEEVRTLEASPVVRPFM